MAIASGMCTSFRSEILGGVHDLTADTIKGALFTSSAALGSDTTLYSTTNEVSGTGYSAGGKTLTSPVVSSTGSSGYADFDDITWTGSSFTAAGLQVYNSSTKKSQANRSIAIYSFGGNRTVSNGTFQIQLPSAAEGSAFIEIDD